MQEEKNDIVLDIPFSIIFDYADAWLGLQGDTALTNIHVLYTSIVKRLLSINYSTFRLTTNFDKIYIKR